MNIGQLNTMIPFQNALQFLNHMIKGVEHVSMENFTHGWAG